MKKVIENLKKKARKIWRDHKGLIIGGGLLIGAAIVAAASSKEESTADGYISVPEDIRSNPEIFDTKPDVEPSKEEHDDDWNKDDPLLPCGGRYRQNELADNQKTDNEHMSGFGSIIINDVPLANMGQLGQDVIDLCRQAGLEEKGWENMENAMACMILGIQAEEMKNKPAEDATDDAEEKKEEDAA